MSFVRVTEDENEEPIEIPTEEDNPETDGTLLLSSLSAQYPGACGLKYRSESGGLRGIRLANGNLHPPNGFWGDRTYIVVFPKETKRKGDEGIDNPQPKMKRVDTTKRCSDLIVLGLPWKSEEEDVREYFEKFGELVLVQVKRDPKTKMSKGFGFVRFKNYDDQCKCLSARHNIGGRWCEVALPNSNDPGTTSSNRKIFVARCTEDITTEDLRTYFEEYGEVVDVFIPKPFRAFAFVTFQDPGVAQRLCGEDHIIKGASVHLSTAAPKAKDPFPGEKRGAGSGSRNFGGGGGYSGGYSQDSPRESKEMQSWGGGARDGGMGQGMGLDPGSMNNVGMNMLSSAMLAAAQAMFQGQAQQGSQDYQLGPGFGGTRDSRSTTYSQQQGWGDQSSQSSGWGSSSGRQSSSGTGSGSYSSQGWGSQSRGWNQ